MGTRERRGIASRRVGSLLGLAALLVLAALGALAQGRPAEAAASVVKLTSAVDCVSTADGGTTLDFEDGSTIAVGDFYAAKGVRFPSTAQTRAIFYANTTERATSSPPTTVANDATAGNTSANVPLTILFDQPQAVVGMYLGNNQYGINPTATLTAFDLAGTALGSVSLAGGSFGNDVTTFLGIEPGGGGIRKVTLDYGNTTLSEEIDDLCFGNRVPVDQSQVIIPPDTGGLVLGGANAQQVGQTVTAGVGGRLTHVSLPVACGSEATLVIEIRNVFNDTPYGLVLSTTTYPGSKLPSFFPAQPSFRMIPLTGAPPIAVGERFAIVLGATGGGCAVFPGPEGNPYPGGSAYYTSTEPSVGGNWFPIGGGRDDIPFKTHVLRDTTPPTAALTGPAGGTWLSGTQTLSADATDDLGVAYVEFSLDRDGARVPLGQDATRPYTLDFDSTTVPDGQTTNVYARAVDLAGNSSLFSGRTIWIDNTAPTGAITRPAADGVVVFDSVLLRGNVADSRSGVRAVTFAYSPAPLSDAAVVSRALALPARTWTDIETVSAPGSEVSATWNASALASGDYDLRLTVVDRAGNQASSFRRVTVDNKPAAARLVVAQQSDVDSLDPALAFNPASHQILRNTCTTLYGYPVEDGEFVATPRLEGAQSVSISNLGKSYTFTPRAGLTFATGEPITAASYERAFLRLLAPATSSPVAAEGAFDIIAGAKEYRQGAAAGISGIVVREDGKLAITLLRRSGGFPAALTTLNTCPVPVEAPAPTATSIIPSSGPYTVLRHVPGHQLWLGRNESYGGSSAQNSADIVVNIRKPAELVAEVENGLADLTPNVIVSERSRLDALYGPRSGAVEQRYFKPKTAGVQVIVLNQTHPVLSNPLVRRAIDIAVRRGAYAAQLELPRTDQVLPEPILGYVDVRLNDEPSAADIAEATELVSQANAGGTALRILVPSNNAPRVVAAELLAADLRAIGLNPTVTAESASTAFSRMAAGAYEIGLVGWLLGSLDPFNHLHGLFHSSQIGTTNFQRTNDPEGLDLELVAADALSGAARYDAFRKIDHKVSSGHGMVPYANLTAADFYGEDVGCQVYDPVVGVVWGELCSRSLVSNITLDGTAAVPAGASAVPIGSVPFAQLTSGAKPVGTELGGIELGGIGLNGVELGGIELGGIELGGIELGGIELGGIELGGIGLNKPGILSALSSMTLSSVQLTIPGGWELLLQNTPLQGVPLQSVTLAQVIPLLSDPSSPPALRGLKLGQMSLAGTELGGIELGGIVLGGIELGGISLLGNTGARNLADWCDVLTTAGYTACNTATVGSQTLVGLAFSGIELGGIELGGIELGGIALAGTELGGIELGGIRLAGTELGGIELGGIALAGTKLGGIELGGIVLAGSELGGIELGGINLAVSELGGIELGGISNVSSIVDCSLVANCGPGTTLAQAKAADAILSTATLADLQGALGSITLAALQGALTGYQLEDLKFYNHVTLAEIQALLGPGMTLGMLLQALLNPADLPWESMDLNGIPLQRLDPSSVPAAYTARFSVSGAAGAQSATEVTVTLPQGFLYVAGSSTRGVSGGTQALIADPVQSGRKLTWELAGISVGTPYELHFRALPGLRLGVAATSALAIPAGGAPSLGKPANTVIQDTFEPNDDPLGTPTVAPDVLYFSYTASGDDVDYFKFPAPAPGSRINVYLSHLDYDADLVLYSPTRQRIIDTAATGVPVDGEPVLDDGLEGAASLSPETLADVPIVPSLPVAGFSVNRGTGDEQVRTVAHASSGFYRIQVSGYNGAASTSPYMLRVEITQPLTPSCTPRALSYTGTTQGTLPASWAGLNLNTVFIFNRERFGATFGPQAATDTLTALEGLAARADLGVKGAVVQVDGSQAVRSAYAAWDQNPCAPSAANGVVGSIVDILEDVRTANPTLQNVVLVGADDVVPMARIPDLTQLFNEREYASTFRDNQYFGSFATQNLLSDDPYGDRDPLAYLDRQLFIPDEALGRLVETPAEIQGLVARFQHADVQGLLQPKTAAVTRYDFLTDGGDAIASALTANGLATSGLTGETWDKTALSLLVGGAPDVLSVNAHYDHKRSLPALGNSTGDETDLYSTPDLPDATLAKLQDGIAFTMGCHGGLNVSDIAVGATELDWPQAFARQRAASYFANSGFGLGDTEVVAYTERLMEEFAKNLDGSMSLGRAAVKAKREYFLGTIPYGVYDEKVMAQTIFYGLPMYRLGGVTAPLTSASSANIQSDPVTQLDSATFAIAASTDPASPTTLSRRDTPRGTYYDAEGGVQVTHYRPIQPSVQLDVSAPGRVAHDALVLAAESTDLTGIDPVNSRPIVDLAAHEPEPNWQDVAFPTKLVGVSTASGPDGLEQRLNASLGQFFDDGVDDPLGRGVQRLYTRLEGLVYYNASNDHSAPDVHEVQATVLDRTLGFTVRAADGQAGAAGVVRAYVLFRDASGGVWKGGDLTRSAGTDLWVGGFPVVGNRAEYNVQVVDAHGNVGVAAGKDIFVATASPPPPPSIGMTISGVTGNGEWYVSDTLVALESRAGSALEYSVDGGKFVRYQSRFLVSGDAVHRIDFRSASGREGHALVAIDKTAPTIALRSPKANSKHKLNVPLEIDFACADTGSSGVAACAGTRADATFVDTSVAGSDTITVTATDIAGNVTVESRSFSWFADTAPTVPGTPTLEGSSPNRGLFGLKWVPSVDSHDDPITYSLRHKDADDADFSGVAAGIGTPFFTFALPAGEAEGTWTYDVAATDGALTSAASAPSVPVKVDRTPPNAPGVTIDGTPTLVGAEVWYADSALVHGTSTDPKLADGSAGSGVVSVTGPVAVTTSGANPVTITATDAVGFSSATNVTVNLDVNVPQLTLSCLTGPVHLASSVGAAWTASDPGESGIAGATSGVLAYDTASLGAKTATLTVTDHVGHSTRAVCNYTVIYDFEGFLSPVANTPILNQVGAGRSVPMKFSLKGDRGLAVVEAGSPVSQQVECDTGSPVHDVLETTTAGSSSLQYDASKDQYTYVWKTASAWVGQCRLFRLVLVDGTEHRALFRFK